jgi:DUF1680 family protein
MTMTSTTTAPAAPVVPTRTRLRPLGLDEVRIDGGFWGDRQRINATATLAHIGARLESEGWLPNFDLAAAGALPAGRRGREFSDSEVYKYLEALAWEVGRSDSPEVEERLRAVVARVGAAQEADGYLDTNFGRPGQAPRWSDLEWGHELYCLGHVFQAAVARVRTRPDADDGLIGIAVRAAELVCATFGVDGNQGICGHAEIEVGLAELGRAVGRPDFVEQAALFVERRGHGTLADIEYGRAYYQDDVPVREADVLRGHAVRANYLAAGAVDVAVESGDEELLGALQRQWDRTAERRTYITGGQGSHHQDEAFGQDWELPADRAYSETCASIGSIMFSWRLLLADGDARHADLIERTLYNVVATSPSREGTAFYYTNTLHQRVPGIPADPDGTSPRATSSLRAPWFDVSCCPPNVARTVASLASYVATTDDDGVQLHQFAPGSVRTVLPGGTVAAFDVETAYPADGRVRIRIAEPGEWTLSLRVPGWAQGATLAVGGARATVAPGYVAVHRAFAVGEAIELELPMQPRVVRADDRVDAVRGCVAIERGPEVLALESTDLAPLGVDDVADVVADAPPVEWDGVVRLPVRGVRRDAADWPNVGLEVVGDPIGEVPLIAYHDWANRGPSTMRVWIPTAPEE